MLTPFDDNSAPATPKVMEKLFFHQDTIARHLAAPLLRERQVYLGKLLAAGYKRQFVADRASTLCHIVERGWFAEPEVREENILSTLIVWLGNSAPTELKALRYRGKDFISIARHWTTVLGT